MSVTSPGELNSHVGAEVEKKNKKNDKHNNKKVGK